MMRAGLGLGVAGTWLILLQAAAVAAPPAVNLGIEVRFVQDGNELPRGGRGSVVVGTQGSTTLAGSVTLTTATPQRDDSLQQVHVLNGAHAQLRLARLVPLRRVQWTWSGGGAAAGPGSASGAASASAQPAQGLAETTQWVDTARGFELRPQWPGGSAPVLLEISFETSGEPTGDASGHTAGPRRLRLSTTVQVPLGEWFVLGRVGQPPVAAADNLTVSTTPRTQDGSGRVEVRVLAP